MSKFFIKWITISFLNLFLVASLGVILRYKIAFYLPLVQQKFVLDSHSHFAFYGWITQTLMLLMVHYLSLRNGERTIKKYRWLLYANLIPAYGMMISFVTEGYGTFSSIFFALSILVSYIFSFVFWKELDRMNEKMLCHLCFKAAMIFNIISSIGVFALAYMLTTKTMLQNWYLASTYFFLHFQYNGWFFFGCMGLLVSKLEKISGAVKHLRLAFLLFCFACPPAYFLSALWIPFPPVIYLIIIAAVIAQLIGWILIIKVFMKIKININQHFSKYGKVLLILSAIALSIKLLLQSGSLHPSLSQLSYGFRPIVIGYLHLVLLAVISIFLIGYIVSFELIPVTNKLLKGVFIFVSGIILNEMLLMVQGVAALNYNSVPYINILLLFAAVVLLSGVSIIFICCVKTLLPGKMFVKSFETNY